MPQIGTASHPLRVAIIGSGPSGFYAAEHYFKQPDLVVSIDMYDRLPTPYGLVRGGVAPDHPKIKSVTKVYDKIAAHPAFRFFGNVEIGKHISHATLKEYYHQVVYAVGAQSDRKMGIPGEDLIGSHAATEFVGWYNAHPDYRDLEFDLSQRAVAVIGNGNVAMDVARILASSDEELRTTDIADYALEALRNSNITDIYMLGRRGPAQAAFTNPELKEMGELREADVIVAYEEAQLDDLSREWLAKEKNPVAEKNVRMLQDFAARGPQGKRKRVHMRFLVSPTELLGENGRVTAIRVVKNVLQPAPDGSLRPKATGQTYDIPVGLVFRSIGYKGVELPGLPFDEKNGIIPNTLGRVTDSAGAVLPGVYVTGWIKRGPSGIIGTNKPDSVETVNAALADLPNLPEIAPEKATPEAVEALVRSSQPAYVTFADWGLLDAAEVEAGAAQGRPRIKFSRIAEMLETIQARKASEPNPTA